jgi:hypothetical protein
MEWLRNALASSLFIVATSLPLGAAWAQQWQVRVTGPDVFGNTKVIAVVEGPNDDALVVQCDAKDQLELAYIEAVPSSEISQAVGKSVPETFLIKAGSGNVQKFDAILQVWNNTHFGTGVSGRTPQLIAVLNAIGTATGAINIGVESAAGDTTSQTFSAAGSTAVMHTVITNCNLQQQ